MKKTTRAILISLLVVALAWFGGWFVFTRRAGPDAAAGHAWLDGFATLLTSPGLLGARGPAALSRFPGLGTWPASGCETTWRRTDGLGSILVSQSLELARQPADPCEQAEFGQLSTVLQQSEGVTPGAFVHIMTEQFGVPAMHRDSSLAGSVTYEWDLLYGIHLRVAEPVRPGGADTFSVVLTRYVGAPTAIPSAADGEDWLNRVVDLLTGPDLPAAHGRQAVQLVDGGMVADPPLGGGCATSFSTTSATPKEAFAYEKSLSLHDTPTDCANGVFDYLSMTIWQRPPVTVKAVVQRLEARLGPPVLNRDFQTDTLRYEWKTRHGSWVGVAEYVWAADRLFSVTLARSDTPR